MGRKLVRACYRELGAELCKRREAAGLTVRDLAQRSGWSPAKVSRIENGLTEIDVVDLIFYVGFCEVYRAQALDLIAMCRDAERKLGYWLSPHDEWLEDSLSSLIYHEATAHRSTSYSPNGVHGLLQTADYARSWIVKERWRSRENIEECVRIRLERQRVLHMRMPGQFTFFMHEQALHRQMGDSSIMHDQLLHVVLLALLDNVTVRVVPSAAEAEFGGPFHLFEYAQHPPLVYLDNHTTGLFLEDPEFVTAYRELVPVLADAALNGEQSRQLIASLAGEHDRGSERDAGYHLEEEQL